LNPEIECRTDRETLAESVAKIMEYLETCLPIASHSASYPVKVMAAPE
jgi:hypothetical protein